MALSFLSRKARVVTITIEEDAIRHVDLQSSWPLELNCAEELLLPTGIIEDGKIVDAEALASVLDKAVNQWGLSKKSVRFLAPDEFVIVRKVPYPENVQVDELKGHFFIEIGSTLYLPFEDPVFDVVPYHLEDDQPEAIIIASRESVVQAYEDAFEKVKLKAVVADITPLALYRLTHLQHNFEEEEHVMLIDLQSKKMTVSIFHEHYPMFMRPIDIEIEDPFLADRTAVMDSVEIEAEKLANFYRYNMNAGQFGVTKIVCNGDFYDWPTFQQNLERRFQIPVLPVVIDAIPCGQEKDVPRRFNRAIGLALKEV
ncbi:Tfp pilus assembly protein, ATPase PilM [Planococcus donghaensis MPA1U2]|uniref:Tfp pilus assembly protein, ATPase PilM n=1 Tax=Planococcus donghaensis MPA1U2 TaxID=933115 RepID=E7RIJ2_9BACL|nr:pilus assembly protein PilM [Planococcus donghaensis]EGA89098.1 Tfp pilus assembly protein, ATPase PilM [Planococcus donghaensis MPA1U2]